MVKAGPHEVYVKALDSSLRSIDDAAEVSELFAPIYRFWRVDLRTMTTTRDDSRPPTSSGNYFFEVDGQT